MAPLVAGGCAAPTEKSGTTTSATTDGDSCVSVSPPGLASSMLCNGARGDFRAMQAKYDSSMPGPSFGWLLEGETQKPTWGVSGSPRRTHVVFERVTLNSIDGGRQVGIGFTGLWAMKRAREARAVPNQNWEAAMPSGLCDGEGGTFYPETGHCLSPAIQRAYEQTGGPDPLERHGYPLSELVPGVLEDGTMAWVQYTEKSRFEIAAPSYGPRPGGNFPFPPPSDPVVTTSRLGAAFLAGRIAFGVQPKSSCEASSCTCSSASVDIVCASPIEPSKIATFTWKDLLDSGLLNVITVQPPESSVPARPGASCDQLLAEACMGVENAFDAFINGNIAAIKNAMTQRVTTPSERAVLSDPQTKCTPFYRPVLATGSCE